MALVSLADGHGATVVVAGEAGVGKSRLLREAAEEGVRRGALVLTGRAVERDSPLPFRPLAEALFSHLRKSGPPQVRELAPFRPILGRLVPEWRLPGESPGEESLVVLGEAVLRLLATLGEGAGCVLVLEDLHWADAETIEVVEYLADNIADEPVLCCLLRSVGAARGGLGLLSLLRQAGAPVPRRRRSAPDLPAPMATLGVTPRQAEVLAFLAEGRSTREIAARLYVSPKTVERHIANLAAKVGVGGRSELVHLRGPSPGGGGVT